MDEKLLTDIFSEKREVPNELRRRIHSELIKEEKRIMMRNIIIALSAIIIMSFFIIAFVVIFFGNIITLFVTGAFLGVYSLMAIALAGVAGKYEIRNIQKGML